MLCVCVPMCVYLKFLLLKYFILKKKLIHLPAKSLQSCLTLCNPLDKSSPSSSVHGILHGVGCHALLQGIFSTQGLNPCLLHCKQILYC